MLNISPEALETALLEAALVDRLAALKAEIASLQLQEKAAVDALKATGKDRIRGTTHEAVVSITERETVDTKALRADLGEDCIAPYLRKADVITLKVTARKTH